MRDWALYWVREGESSEQIKLADESMSIELSRYFYQYGLHGRVFREENPPPKIELELRQANTQLQDFIYPIPGLSIGMREDVGAELQRRYPNLGTLGELVIAGQEDRFKYWLFDNSVQVRHLKNADVPSFADKDFDYDQRKARQIDIAQEKTGVGYYICSDYSDDCFLNTYKENAWTGLTFTVMQRF